MIFFAVAAPTPGRASSSFCDAVFKSTFPPEGAADAIFSAAAAFVAFVAFSAFSCTAAFAGFSAFAAAPPPTVTRGVNFSIVLAERPALARSETEE